MRNEKFRDLYADEPTLYADNEVRRLSFLDDFCLQHCNINESLQKEPLMLLLTICRSVAHDAQQLLKGPMGPVFLI